MLIFGGQNLQDVINLFDLAPKDTSRDRFEELMRNIERHFASLTDPTLTHQALLTCKQLPGERASDFYVRLMKLMSSVDYDGDAKSLEEPSHLKDYVHPILYRIRIFREIKEWSKNFFFSFNYFLFFKN